MYIYYYVYVFLLLCMFCSVYSVPLCCSVYCLCVNVYCTTATWLSTQLQLTNISLPLSPLQMALQSGVGLGLRYNMPPGLSPRLDVGFRNSYFLQGKVVSLTPKPQPGGPGYPPLTNISYHIISYHTIQL